MIIFSETLVDNVLLVRMDDGKANAIGNTFIQELDIALDKSDEYRALIITGNQRFFSAGLSLPEVHGLDRPAMERFIDRFDALLRRLTTLPLPTVAAISGHAVAGGLILAFACDYRLAVSGDYRVGLSELDLGIPLPMAPLELFRRAVPSHLQVEALATGAAGDPAWAKSVGMVHRLSDSLRADALEAARKLSRSPKAYGLLKRRQVAPHLEAMEREQAEVNAEFTSAWFSPAAMEKREAVLARLGSTAAGR